MEVYCHLFMDKVYLMVVVKSVLGNLAVSCMVSSLHKCRNQHSLFDTTKWYFSSLRLLIFPFHIVDGLRTMHP